VIVPNNQVPVNVVQQMQPIPSTQPPQQSNNTFILVVTVNGPMPIQNTPPPNMNGQSVTQITASGRSEIAVNQQGQLVNGQVINQRPVGSQ